MAHYQTVQRKNLIDFLTLNSEKAFTVEELEKEMGKTMGMFVPGRSTLYRLIRQLSDDGIVKRLVKGNSRKFIYQIAAGEHCAQHLHLKCVRCGRLLHMGCDESAKILREVLRKNSFLVDRQQTVLMGNCEDCNKSSDSEVELL